MFSITPRIGTWVFSNIETPRRTSISATSCGVDTTTAKVGAAISVFIIFPILAAVGYNGKEGALNSPHAIFGLEMCYLFAPIIMVFFGGGVLFGYKLDNARHSAIREALDRRAISASVAGAEETLSGIGISPEPAE